MGREPLKRLGAWLFTVALEVGAGLMALQQAWVVVAVLALAGVAVLAAAYFPGWGNKSKMLALLGMIFFGLGFLGCAGWYFWPTKEGTVKTAKPMPHKPWKHTLEDLYASDFPDLMSTQQALEATVADPARGLEATVLPLRFRLYQDFRSNTDFVSIFIPISHDVRIKDKIYGVIVSLRDQITIVRDGLRKSVGIGMRGPGVPYTEAKDLRFSGRVFIYTDEAFTVVQLGEMTSWYEAVGLSLQIRGTDYWFANKDR